ncbi:MAG: Ig-like domain-containing protein [Terriglobales bacterium]
MLTGFTFSPTAVDTTTSSATVNVTAQVTDNLSGVNSVHMDFVSPSGAHGAGGYLSLTSGNDLNGTWTGAVTLTAYTEAGTWSVAAVVVEDNAGNSQEYYTSDLQALGFPTQLFVDVASTTTTVTSSSNPSVLGQSVTFTATVTPQGPGAPTGSVTFSDGSTALGTSALSGGTATFSTSTLAIGLHSINAVYSGDANFASSSASLNQTLNQATTSIAVTGVSPAAEDYGLDMPATITAVLSWTGNGVAPTASAVTIGGNGPSGYGATSCGTPSGTTMTCTAIYMPTAADGPGSYTESATFAGDVNYSGSSSTQINNFTINQATSGTVVTSSINPSTYGQSVTFTATINGENGLVKGRSEARSGGAKKIAAQPQDVTGAVTWSANTGCGTTPVASGNPGVATCTTSILPGGTDAITATYSGDGNHSGGTGTLSGGQVVDPAPQTITFTQGVPPGNPAYNSSFTVAATASSGLAVTFSSSGSCSNQGATYTMTSGTGICVVTASQAGNGNYSAATPAIEEAFASKASQTITVTTPAPPTATNKSSFTVFAGASSGLPISFGSAGSCTNSGATYTIDKASGTCALTMTQAGNSDYNAATPIGESVAVVAPVAPSVSFTGAPASAAYGATFTATASSNETGIEASVPVITTTSTDCTITGTATTGTSVTATVAMTSGNGTCTLKATWAANDVYSAAAASQHTAAKKSAPVGSFTGAPADASNGTNFTVTATSNESGIYISVPSITTTTSLVCSVGAVTSNGSGGYQATVTMIKATGTCTTKAAWALNPNYAAASAVQHTAATP